MLNDKSNIYSLYEVVIIKEMNNEYTNGFVKGANKERKRIAKRMIQRNVSLEKIMKYTGLTKKELFMLL